MLVADHMYKMSDVPRGKRFRQFMDYYKYSAIAVLVVGVIVISLIKTIFFTPSPDSMILVAGSKFMDDILWNDLKVLIESTDIDFNNDGKSLVELNLNSIDENAKDKDPQYYNMSVQRMVAVLSTGDYIIQIVDDDMFTYLKDENLIGKYNELSDYDIGNSNPDDDIKIPLKNVSLLNGSTLSKLSDNFYITLRPRDASTSEKKRDKYNAQVELLARLAGFNKIG